MNEAAALPSRSVGVRWTTFGTGLLLHDEVRNQVHLLNDTAQLVWLACDGVTTLDEAAETFAVAANHPVDQVRDDIGAHVATLRDADLLGRAVGTQVAPPPDTVDEPGIAARLQVLDDVVVISSNDLTLAQRLAEPFSALRVLDGRLPVETDSGHTHHIGIHATSDAIRVYGMGHDQMLASEVQVVDVLTSLVNTAVRATPSVLALHAGAVRSPEGSVVVIAGHSGAGKSTLTAALVNAGWDYLTDEAVGIRASSLLAVGYPKPLALDASSRTLLAMAPGRYPVAPIEEVRPDATAICGDAGPVTALIILDPDPNRDPAAADEQAALSPAEALVAIAPHAINLVAAADHGLGALAQLAHRVTIRRLARRDLDDAVRFVQSVATHG